MRFLLHKMYPAKAAEILRDGHGHDAIHVAEVGLRAAADAVIADFARDEVRALVTENVVDFVEERDLVLVFVPKRQLPAGRGQAVALAGLLDRWARTHPDPYLGSHWPR